MRRLLRVLPVLVFTLGGFFAWAQTARLAVAPPPAIYFSPGSACTDAAVDVIDHASKVIVADAYGFSNERVIDALVAARARGIPVDLVLDRTDERPIGGRSSGALRLRAAGASVRFDSHEPIHHSKVLVVDAETVFSGSYNFTKQGERNAENCRVERDPRIASLYLVQHNLHREHSE